MAQAMRKSARCSIIVSDRIKICSVVVNHLGSCRRSRTLSITNSRVLSERYRFNNCLARIMCNTEANLALRLRYRRIWATTVVCGGPAHCGTSGTSPPKVVLSVL